ncbi:Transketolase [Pseudolycoriella hygida]|uniref:transketolase n=1 Tax=Pseudolycoriella hygida TaxID=35572 RepID=A0A9Q0N790_9DIPT|nr:Transketolase [Pseudolycoriella hygida]
MNSAEYLKLSNCIRILASDSIEFSGSGHPGMVLGFADVMTILGFNFLKFNPSDPNWFNRDRLVLSAGHGSMLLYTFYYLTNYKNFGLNDLKQFRQFHSKTPGHPEYGAYAAIETTTGPLGQGFATSVGMAIAQKKYEQKLGKIISDHKIYCIVGDGCLMEGVSYEAASLAGHLCLDNLIVLFDDNKITIDGEAGLTVSENHLLKFKSLGWNSYAIDGHNFTEINTALHGAQNTDKPTFIACRTLIGKGCSNKINCASVHGSPLGKEEIKSLKKNLCFEDMEFYIPPELKNIWEAAWLRNKENYDNWQKNFLNISEDKKYYLTKPNINCSFLDNIIPPGKDEATRSSAGRIIKELAKLSDKIIFGSADLGGSNNILSNLSQIISKDDFSGNYLHYGVREHAMAAIMNGLSLSGFLAIGGTFLVFSDYMRPSMRLACLMRQQVIYILTHDSIGVGEDGPTHQPVEHLATLRALPGMNLFRPADYIETREAWRLALNSSQGPSVLALTRQVVPQISDKVVPAHFYQQGAYMLVGDHNKSPDITIFSTGSELSIALTTKEILQEKGFTANVVSLLCFELFFKQDVTYIRHILTNTGLKVAIEAGCSLGWHKIIGENGLFFGIESFGHSAPAAELYSYFALTPVSIAKQIFAKLLKNAAVSDNNETNQRPKRGFVGRVWHRIVKNKGKCLLLGAGVLAISAATFGVGLIPSVLIAAGTVGGASAAAEIKAVHNVYDKLSQVINTLFAKITKNNIQQRGQALNQSPEIPTMGINQQPQIPTLETQQPERTRPAAPNLTSSSKIYPPPTPQSPSSGQKEQGRGA